MATHLSQQLSGLRVLVQLKRAACAGIDIPGFSNRNDM
jgi:hypothetical protein